VTNDGTLIGGNLISKVFSHELTKALTDPNIIINPLRITLNNNGDKIGDVCNNVY
jgi:hypothetical protein